MQSLDVVFDTGSDWLVIEDQNCVTCPALKKFDSSKSSTFNIIDAKVMKLEYGSAKLSGVRVTDRVCVQG